MRFYRWFFRRNPGVSTRRYLFMWSMIVVVGASLGLVIETGEFSWAKVAWCGVVAVIAAGLATILESPHG